MKLTEVLLKERERDRIAEDIKDYLAKGGIISRHAHGESNYVGKKPTMDSKKPHPNPIKKG
tara:strand:+ start:271 stop:453 length:183 start_codon:yes stop_codon:yes gene_type:complete